MVTKALMTEWFVEARKAGRRGPFEGEPWGSLFVRLSPEVRAACGGVNDQYNEIMDAMLFAYGLYYADSDETTPITYGPPRSSETLRVKEWTSTLLGFRERCRALCDTHHGS